MREDEDKDADEDEDEDKGPDLAVGIATADLPEGKLLAGTFGDDAVVLINAGGRICALAATCTHLGGPLAEGIVVDGEVRCPWHHARFSIATGEAVAAPAFEPLVRFDVEQRDGRILVIGRSTDSPDVRKSPGPPKRVVIVGGGAGGHACAEMLVRTGFDGAVTMVGDDVDRPYDRTFCSKQYLIGMKRRDECFIDAEDPTRNDGPVSRRIGKVVAIDAGARSVDLQDGRRLDFDVLVLATGAEPRRLDVPGFDRPNVHVLRTLRDADALIDAAGRAGCVAIVGASFIGLEVAASLRQRELDVHVVAPDDVPLAKIVGARTGAMIQKVHEEKGVRFHLGRDVASYDGRRLVLDDGSTVDADFVVVAVGVTPRTELAEAAGLDVASSDDGGGVIVDERLQTSVAGIYAIGDIARYPDRHAGKRIRVEHWVHAQRQGQHVARLLMGLADRYDDLPFFWSAHFDTGLRYLGHVDAIAESHVDGSIEGRDFTMRLVGRDGAEAFVTCNRDLPALQVEATREARRA